MSDIRKITSENASEHEKAPNYSYGYAIAMYKDLKGFEIETLLPNINEGKYIIVRLDGKGLTARFKNDTELFISDFHLAMKRVCENIPKYISYAKFVYSFKDEISILIDKEKFSNSKDNCRLEKTLPIISGFVSAMFSQFISKKFKTFPTEVFAFDARLIVIPQEKVKDYFHVRQSFAYSGFIDRICSFKRLNVASRTFSNVKNALVKMGDNWFNYPQYVCSGYVGFFDNGKWKVETASDLKQKWFKYENKVS